MGHDFFGSPRTAKAAADTRNNTHQQPQSQHQQYQPFLSPCTIPSAQQQLVDGGGRSSLCLIPSQHESAPSAQLLAAASRLNRSSKQTLSFNSFQHPVSSRDSTNRGSTNIQLASTIPNILLSPQTREPEAHIELLPSTLSLAHLLSSIRDSSTSSTSFQLSQTTDPEAKIESLSLTSFQTQSFPSQSSLSQSLSSISDYQLSSSMSLNLPQTREPEAHINTSNCSSSCSLTSNSTSPNISNKKNAPKLHVQADPRCTGI